MTKWEYKEIWIEWVWVGTDRRVRKVNGVEVTDQKSRPTIEEFCNQLGAEGWEMVNTQWAGVMHVYFKRPLA